MINTSIPFDIPPEYPFHNDKFDRENIANNLENIINNTQDNLVLSIDTGWGKGKTTFIKMWKQKLENSGKYRVLYFNAWENDDSNDPLLAIIGEMEEILFNNPKNNKLLDKIKKHGITLLKQAVPIALKTLTHGFLDVKNLKLDEFTESQITDLAGKVGEFELSNYKKEKKAKEGFREALSEYQIKEGKKVILFIDELDRCRPTFAIETLERIKHLFNIENYIFVLALDKQQLSYSIETLYGNNMDSRGYLKRFIDLEYILPEPNRNTYVEFLFEYYSLTTIHTRYLNNYLKKMIKIYDFSLRDIDKLFYYLKLVLPNTHFFNIEKENYKDVYLQILGIIYSFFPILKIKKSDLFDAFIRKEYKLSDFIIKTKAQEFKITDENFSSIINKILKLNLDSTFNEKENYVIGDSIYQDRSFDLYRLIENNNLNFINKLQLLDQFSNDV